MSLASILKPTPSLTTLVQLSLPLGLYLGIVSDSSWYWWVIAFFFYAIVYTMIGNNIAYHRYFTHKQFEVARPIEWIFLWAGCLGGLGDPISYSTTHLVHHKHSDTDLDPHGPARGIRSLMFWFYRHVNHKDTPIVGRRVIELYKKYSWAHDYYLLFLLVNIALFWLIDYKVFLFCWLIPASLFTWSLSTAVLLQHWNYKPHNHWIEKYVFWYEGLHANHHAAPSVANTAFEPDQIDWTYQFTRLFRPKYLHREKP